MRIKLAGHTFTVHNPDGVNRSSLFDGIAPIGDYHDWRNWRECVGFKGSRLVHCDGKEINPVTIPQAAKILLRLERAWMKHNDCRSDSHVEKEMGDNTGAEKWLKLISEAL